ncbi:MAG: pilus assembly protein TadG-related protein [Halocynthiibacter sp.]
MHFLSNRPVLQKKMRSRISSSFVKDERGAITMFSVFLIMSMLVIAAIAVNFMRSDAERLRTQNVIDQANLAAGALDLTGYSTDAEAKKVVEDLFNKYLIAAGLPKDSVTVTLNARSILGTDITAKTTVTTKAHFLLGVDELVSKVNSRVAQSSSSLEVAMVLDVSGSMGWSVSGSSKSRIKVLKEATNDFIDILIPKDNTGNTSIAIAPYARAVYAGEDMIDAVNAVHNQAAGLPEAMRPAKIKTAHEKSTCVTFENGDYKYVGLKTGHGYRRTPFYRESYSSSAPTYSHGCYTSSSTSSEKTISNSRKMIPPSKNATQLKKRVGKLTAKGGTNLAPGIKWADIMLSPSFRPVAKELRSASSTGGQKMDNYTLGRPYDYDSGVRKVMVLMTDGDNNGYYTLKEKYAKAVHQEELLKMGIIRYVGYLPEYPWYYSEYNQTVYYENYMRNYVSTSTVDKRSTDLCTKLKSSPYNMIIYAIGFQPSSKAKTLLKNCATSNAHYYEAVGLDLKEAFSSIAQEVRKLQLIE